MKNTFCISNRDYDGDFDLKLTLNSGQTSQPPWTNINNSYYEVLNIDESNVIVQISQDKLNSPLNVSYTGDADEDLIRQKICYIFDLDYDITNVYDFLEDNDELRDVYNFNKGLRLYKAQNPFECIISSICSANNSIKRWTKSINDIKKLAGNRYEFNNHSFFTFPQENVFLNIKKSQLKDCGVGYRDEYMLDSTKKILESPDFHRNISKMSYPEAFDEIIKLDGVGPKVADCILLYGYNKHEAYPVDVWINRITTYLYFNNQKVSNKKIMNFAQERFGKYSGYIQLYLFNYARLSGLMDKLKALNKKK